MTSKPSSCFPVYFLLATAVNATWSALVHE